ncbi:MAG TPA: tRNA (adenosine(37)-N6)-threonylcarbamoyltransferase complex dimerization subunit type 1 TsaB [Fontimonas sp.]
MRCVLAIDTATEACSAALQIDGRLLTRFDRAGRTHTEQLMPMVLGLMAEAGIGFAQLDGYVCGVGPGSFAGVRIGVGYVKGLALAVERPVVGVSSLAMLALPALDARPQAQVVAAIDARMDEIYLAQFRADAAGLPQRIGDEQVCPPAALALAPVGAAAVGVGSGWQRYRPELERALGAAPLEIDDQALPRAASALRIALPQLLAGAGIAADDLQPVYLRNKVALTLVEQQARRDRRP